MYETWLTAEDAAKLTACSVKTLQRMAARGEIQQAQRPVTGRKPVTVFHPDDIARIVEERKLKAFPMPADNKQPSAMIPASQAAVAPAGFAAFLENFRIPPATAPHRRFVTIPEAAEISGLSENFILRAIKPQDGRLPALPAVRDGRVWKLRREDLDKI